MKCLILAAGYATRLYPLTENFPKSLLKIGGKTILDWLIDDIDTLGLIDEYIVVSNHKFARFFVDWTKTKSYNITVVDDGTCSNDTRLGAVRDMELAIKTKKIVDDVFVMAGDNLLDFSLTKFLNYARDRKTTCVMRYYEPNEERLKKCGVMKVDSDGKIVDMVEKPQNPTSHWACPPFYYYTANHIAKVSDAILEGCDTDAPGSFVAWLHKKGDIYSMEMPGKRFDIGNVESYEKAMREYRGFIK